MRMLGALLLTLKPLCPSPPNTVRTMWQRCCWVRRGGEGVHSRQGIGSMHFPSETWAMCLFYATWWPLPFVGHPRITPLTSFGKCHLVCSSKVVCSQQFLPPLVWFHCPNATPNIALRFGQTLMTTIANHVGFYNSFTTSPMPIHTHAW